MQKVAQAWLIVTMTGSRSPLFLGLDSLISESPLLLLTVIGGVFADRRDRRQMMLTSQVTQLVAALGLAMLIHTERIQLAHVFTLSFIVGCVRAFGGPAYQSLLPTLVPRDHLPNAIALNSMQDNVARVIGPMVASVALATLGMATCFALNAVSFVFVIAAILALRDVHVPRGATESMLAQFKGGLRFVRRGPNVSTVIALAFIGAFLGLPLLTFLPVITNDVFHEGVAVYARLVSCSGAGAVLGALAVAWLGRSKHMGRLLLLSLALLGTTMVALALSRTIYSSALILLIAGCLLVVCFSLATALAQLLSPPELRGRVVSLYLVAFLGGSPLGSLASGLLITQMGSASIMLIANGSALTLVALYLLARGQVLKDI